MDKKQQINVWFIIGAVLQSLAFQAWYATYRSVEPIPYSEFQQYLKDGKIASVESLRIP